MENMSRDHTDRARSARPAARFTHVDVPETARSVVLILHGGAASSLRPVDRTSLSWQRARRLYGDLRPGLHADDLGVTLLRFGVKGWNAGRGRPAPIDDARWALDEIAARHDLPVVLLGHSMGARTAVAVADHPAVRGVVGLAPWLPADEPVAALRGKILRAAHGSSDRITSARQTRLFTERATHLAASATFTDMGPVGHYLLRDVGRWNAFALRSCQEIAADRARG